MKNKAAVLPFRLARAGERKSCPVCKKARKYMRQLAEPRAIDELSSFFYFSCFPDVGSATARRTIGRKRLIRLDSVSRLNGQLRACVGQA